MINTSYDFGTPTEEMIDKLEKHSRLLIEWYRYNYWSPNPEKWHLILNFININGKHIFNSEKEKILGVYFDNKLNFEYHLRKLCKRASQKLNALARVSMFMSCQ